MSTEAATIETPPKNAFTAAFDAAMKTEPPDGEDVQQPPVKVVKEPLVKTPKEPKEPATPPEKKSATPRELFKKVETKEGETATTTEPKSAFDDIAEPAFKDEKGKQGWAAQRAEGKKWETAAKTHEARVKELEAKLSEAEPLRGQLAERDATLKEYSEIVARARIEDHPDFRKEFIDGREKIMGRAKGIIEESGGDPKAIEKALNLPSGKARVDALREAMADLDSVQSSRLGRAIDDLNDLDDRADEKRKTAKESYEALKEQDRTRDLQSKSDRQKARGLEFEDTSRRLRGTLEVLQKADGHDEWNARADTILKEAKAYVDEHPDADPEAEILARTNAAYRDLFLQADKLAEERDKEIAELKKELKTIHGKSPSLRSGGSRQATGGEKSNRPFSESFHGSMNGGE